MIIRIIKTISIILLTASAIIALIYNLKDNGQISIYGKITLLIVIISSLATIVLEILQQKKEKEKERLQEAKEEAEQKILSQIQENITNANYSLIPFRLFYTLKHTTDDSIIEKHFKDISGYRSKKKNDILKFIGSGKLGTGYNLEEETPNESICTLQDSNKLKIISAEAEKEKKTVIKKLSRCKIEVYKQDELTTPDIILESNNRQTITELRLYDNWIYQDGIINIWNIKYKNERVYGLSDFKNSRLKINVHFLKPSLIDWKSPPRFINLHLYFGSEPLNLLYFSKIDLENNQKSQKGNPMNGILHFGNELAEELFSSLELEFDIQITDEIFNNQIRQYSS